MQATGGVYLFYSPTSSVHCDLTPGSANWVCLSDRNAKENFAVVDTHDILQRLSAMPITRWNLKGAEASNQHVGPVAQDFHAAFGLGDSDTMINTGDVQGVALAAIQGLYQVVQEKDAQIGTLQEQLTTLQRQHATLEARLAALEQAPQRPAAAVSVTAQSDRNSD